MRRLLLPLLLLFVFSGAVRAEAPDPKDVRAIQACLKAASAAKRDLTTCINVLANPCIGDEGAASSRKVIDCEEREEAVWDQMLNAAYKTVRDGLEEEQQTKLRDMQRSWLETKRRTCEFLYDYFQGTMANPMIANCSNRETARRALFLQGFADDIAQRVKN
jgi:uncharacterized protein YecT (DUF1311 family)